MKVFREAIQYFRKHFWKEQYGNGSGMGSGGGGGLLICCPLAIIAVLIYMGTRGGGIPAGYPGESYSCSEFFDPEVSKSCCCSDAPQAMIMLLAHKPDKKTTLKDKIVGIIKHYQSEISPKLGTRKCRYSPSCSCYGLEAIQKHGILKGTILTIWRLLRCNHFSKGGYDPVPGK